MRVCVQHLGLLHKQGGMPGCSGQFSTADPITPAPDDSSCRSVSVTSAQNGSEDWEFTRSDNISSVVGYFSPCQSMSNGLHVSYI